MYNIPLHDQYLRKKYGRAFEKYEAETKKFILFVREMSCIWGICKKLFWEKKLRQEYQPTVSLSLELKLRDPPDSCQRGRSNSPGQS